MRKESQKSKIRKHLESGLSLTALDALHLFNCFRLAPRISELIREGMNIDSKDVSIVSGGVKKTFSRYKLIKK